jgi:hypothetical protein
MRVSRSAGLFLIRRDDDSAERDPAVQFSKHSSTPSNFETNALLEIQNNTSECLTCLRNQCLPPPPI